MLGSSTSTDQLVECESECLVFTVQSNIHKKKKKKKHKLKHFSYLIIPIQSKILN